jgi:hypothetical protein
MPENQKPMIDVKEGSVGAVTPTNPLIINTDPAVLGTVEIEGGDILIQVKSTVTIASLEKKS